MTCDRLLVVRHGRTEAAREGALGRADVPLDAVGSAQARTIAELLGGERLDRIFCSPLRRALDTATPLACVAGLVPQVHPALDEPDCAAGEGIPARSVGRRTGAGHRPLLSIRSESAAQVWGRLAVFRESVGLDGLPGSTVVVGHYLTDQLLVGMLLGERLGEALRSPLYQPAPGSVAELVRDATGWRMHGFRITALTGAL